MYVQHTVLPAYIIGFLLNATEEEMWNKPETALHLS